MIMLFAQMYPKGNIIQMLIRIIKRIIAQIKFKLRRLVNALKRIFYGGVIVPDLDLTPLPWDIPTRVPYPPIKPDLGPRSKPPRWWFVPPRWYTEAPHWILAPPFVTNGGESAGDEGKLGIYGKGGYLPDDYPADRPPGGGMPSPGTDPPKAAAFAQLAEEQESEPEQEQRREQQQGKAQEQEQEHEEEAVRGLRTARALLAESEGLESRRVTAKLRLESLHQRLVGLTGSVTEMVSRYAG